MSRGADEQPQVVTASAPILSRDLTRHGLTRDVVRGRAWSTPWYGVHVRTDDPSPLLRHRALTAVLPAGTGFGHLTGAVLRDWWLPWLPDDLVMLVTTTGDLHVRRPGTYVRRSPSTRIEHNGDVPLVSAAETLGELALDLSLVDLVVVLDSALRSGSCGIDDVREVAARGRRGCRQLRRALELADPRAESPWETVLRLLHVLSGVADVEVQTDVHDRHGRWLARADLRIRGTRRLPEYDGEVHRERGQHHQDLARDKALARADWERYGYTSREIEMSPGLIIADAEDALDLAPSAERLARWQQYAVASTVTAAGRRRLAARLARYRDAPLTPRSR